MMGDLLAGYLEAWAYAMTTWEPWLLVAIVGVYSVAMLDAFWARQ